MVDWLILREQLNVSGKWRNAVPLGEKEEVDCHLPMRQIVVEPSRFGRKEDCSRILQWEMLLSVGTKSLHYEYIPIL